MDIPISEQIVYIKSIKTRYGLSADKICDVVSKHGGFVTVHTVRRLTAKNAEQKQFRVETVEPVYKALYAQYSNDTQITPVFIYPHYTRKDYEDLIAILKGSSETYRKKCDDQEQLIQKQQRMIEILWHGLQCSGDYEAVVKKYIEEGGVNHG